MQTYFASAPTIDNDMTYLQFLHRFTTEITHKDDWRGQVQRIYTLLFCVHMTRHYRDLVR